MLEAELDGAQRSALLAGVSASMTVREAVNHLHPQAPGLIEAMMRHVDHGAGLHAALLGVSGGTGRRSADFSNSGSRTSLGRLSKTANLIKREIGDLGFKESFRVDSDVADFAVRTGNEYGLADRFAVLGDVDKIEDRRFASTQNSNSPGNDARTADKEVRSNLADPKARDRREMGPGPERNEGPSRERRGGAEPDRGGEYQGGNDERVTSSSAVENATIGRRDGNGTEDRGIAFRDRREMGPGPERNEGPSTLKRVKDFEDRIIGLRKELNELEKSDSIQRDVRLAESISRLALLLKMQLNELQRISPAEQKSVYENLRSTMNSFEKDLLKLEANPEAKQALVSLEKIAKGVRDVFEIRDLYIDAQDERFNREINREEEQAGADPMIGGQGGVEDPGIAALDAASASEVND